LTLIPVLNFSQFKKLATKLKKYHGLTHSTALDRLSIVHGYKNFHVLITLSKTARPSVTPVDESEGLELWMDRMQSTFGPEVMAGLGKLSPRIWYLSISGEQRSTSAAPSGPEEFAQALETWQNRWSSTALKTAVVVIKKRRTYTNRDKMQ